MNFIEATNERNKIENNVNTLSDKLNSFPKNSMGMVLDSAKFSPEFRALKNEFESAFKALRSYNSWYVKQFKKELKQARKRV